MADEQRPRAVSGEIMTDGEAGAGGAPQARIAHGNEVLDAEFVTLAHPQARSESLPHEAPSAIGSAVAPAIGMAMLRQKEPTSLSRNPARGGPLFWTTSVALVFAAFWVSGGHALVRNASIAGIEAPHRALRISGVTSRVDESGVHPILLVDGEAANDGNSLEHLPPIEIAVTGNDGLVTRYRLGTSGRPLRPGETFDFSSRLDAPKNGVKTVTVSFTE
ncbi:MAG: hypothetical protein NTV73_15225 [Hyphomicrobiales bacterium]|nr:hypothetical protein [Hyphomicrobiales bacterium]